MRNKLGVLTDEVSHNLHEALEFAELNQLGHVEIRTVNGVNAIGFTSLQLNAIREEVERRGMVVSCFASPVFKCALSADRVVASGDAFGVEAGDVDEHFRMLHEAFRVTRELGCNQIRIFSCWRETDPGQYENEVASLLRSAAVEAEQAGIKLLLENEPACNGGFTDEVGRLVRMVDSPYLRALWDPGNDAYGGRTAFPDGYRAIVDVVSHVHLKDAVITAGQPKCVPIGMGSVPYRYLLQVLLQDGYGGLFTLETHFVPEGGTAKDGSTLSLVGLRQVEHEAGISFGRFGCD